MPDITELLDHAAPTAGGPAPFEDIVRRGHRRKVATRAAAVAAPVAAVAIVVAVVVAGGSPTGVVIDPPPMIESPDPTPTPSAPTTDEGATEDAAPDPGPDPEVGTVTIDELGVEAFVVGPTESAFGEAEPSATRHRPGASALGQAMAAGFPTAAGLVPDGDGGFAWQPDSGTEDPAPVLHRDGRGEVRTLMEAEAGQTLRLVGAHDGHLAVLISVGSGSDFDTATVDLLSVPFDDPEPELLIEGIGGWEQGVKYAAADGDTVLYAEWVEAMERVVVRRSGGEPVVVFEGGELTGEYVRGVGIMGVGDLGIVLVEGTTDDGQPTARLLSIHLGAAEVIGEPSVPLQHGAIEGMPPIEATDLSVFDRYFAVSRVSDGFGREPLVYDIADQGWSLVDDSAIAGRTFLAPSTETARGEPAACAAEDDQLRNADAADEPGPFLYVACTGVPAPDVYRLLTEAPVTGDLETDLQTVVPRLFEPLPIGQQGRGYHPPLVRGQAELLSLSLEGGAVVIDLALPNGAGALPSDDLDGERWQRALAGTVFQFDGPEQVEVRVDGECSEEPAFAGDDGCLVLTREDAPWRDR